MKSWLACRSALITLALATAASADDVPGRWGTTDTSRPPDIVWPATWAGARNLRAQWFKILAESPQRWRAAGYLNHAKGEPPDNTYYLWRYDRPVPDGTKILIEGDFPHARMMSFQVCAPHDPRFLGTSDGVGVPEIHLLDEDIVPDPGHTNPYLPGADRTAKRRHFHISFELRDGDPVALNGRAALPPYRAPGNLRVGCTGTSAPGSTYGARKSRGPVVYMRMYLPDRYDPFGGVEPPVIRMQFPGGAPQLAPVSRAMPINLRRFVQDYRVEENPALADGRSVKEQEANADLRAYAQRAIRDAGQPGTLVPGVHKLFDEPDGTLRLFKAFQTPYLVTYFKDYLTDPEGCRGQLPRRYRAAFGAMGPQAPPPGNDEHVSNHHVFNTYLVGVANLGPGQLLVFRGKAPRTPRTLQGNAVMESSDELRYWNISLHAGAPTRLTPVVNLTDEETVLDRDGRYSIVIGRAADRPANANPANGITWRTWPVGDRLSVNVRLMSTAARTWAHAPQLVTWAEGDYCVFGRNPQAVRARMGEYFPAGRYLSTAEVESLARASKSPDAAAAAEAQVGTHDRTLTVDGRRRSYRLYVPAAHPTTRRLPLVIALHGGQSSGHEMEVLTGLSALAEREQFLAVYPDAIGVYRDKRYWNDGRVPEVDDVKFIGMLIDELVRSFAADPARVYVTGISNGASMTNRLGVALAERIAAIAPVAGTIGVQAADRWQPARPLPVVYFHGTADPLAYYDGGSAGTYRGSALSAPDYVRWWARHNGCAAAARSEPLPDATADGTRVTRVAHDGCRVGAEVVLYRIESGGHTWPGGRQYLPERVIGKTSRDIDANAVMWEFFKRHPLP